MFARRALAVGVLLAAPSVFAAGGVRTVVRLAPEPALVTRELQSAIDAASAAGGGTVVVPSGRYVTGAVLLKDNVTLHLEEGAELVASTNRQDFFSYLTLLPPDFDLQKEYPGARTDAAISNLHAVVGAFAATNVAIEGRGTINGRGRELLKMRVGGDSRWRNLLFYRCRNVRVEDVTLRDSAFWTFYLKECVDVYVRGITIDGQAHWNNDGIDIDAKNVLIEDCTIDALDDAICPKSDCPNFLPENIEVRNCRLASNCNFIKFGTSCRAGFRNCRIHDCVLVPSWKSDLHHHNAPAPLPCGVMGPFPGVTNQVSGLSGIAIESPDGGRISDIHVWNIDMTAACVQTPVFIRLQNRAPRVGEGEATIENVLIENVKGCAVSQIASSITGVPGLRVKGVTLRNIEIETRGGGTLAASSRPVPEKEKSYPDPTMFDLHMLPAYGFYLRHADGIRFENVKLTYGPDGEERPPVVQDDCTDVTFKGCSFQEPAPLVRAADADGVEWYDGEELAGRGLLEGKAFWDTACFYDRLPASASNKVSSVVWSQARCTSGECFRFRTTSPKIRIRAEGVDVYVFLDGEWRARPGTDLDVPPETPVMIYLPSRHGIDSFKLGLDARTTISPLPLRTFGTNHPIVFCGGASVQGADACRRLDLPLVDLSFEGEDAFDEGVLDCLTYVWADCFVLGCDPDAVRKFPKPRYESFVRRLCRAHARTPIVLVPQAEEVKAVHEKLVVEGARNLLLADGCGREELEKAVRAALVRGKELLKRR